MGKAHFVDIDGKVYNADSCVPLNEAWTAGDIQLKTLARGSYPGHQLCSNELEGVKSIGFWDATKSQNWGLGWHRNEGIEICFLERGKLHFDIEKSSYLLQPRDLTITRPWLSHKLGNPNIGACRLHWIILDVGVRHPHQQWRWPPWIILNKDDLHRLTTFLRQNEAPVWSSSPEIATFFLQIAQLVEKGESYDTRLKINLNALLVALLDLFDKGDIELNDSLVQSRRTVELVLQDLGDHLMEPWTVESIAHHCNLGTTQVTKYCKEITNMSPMQYLSTLRLEKSAEMLRQARGKSISEIAYESGFSSPQYFATVFKQFYNQTPQQFREQM